MKNFETINPANEETVQTYTLFSENEVEEKLAMAHSRFITWQQTSLQERQDHVMTIAETLEQNAREAATLITQEMGKPIKQAHAELEKCAQLCRHYVEHSEDYLASRTIPLGEKHAAVHYCPLGPILGIMPWNFPFWQVFRFAIPTLMAGNVGLLKHARNVTGCARMIEDIFMKAGLPEGTWTALVIDDDQAARVIRDSRIQGVSLTGSDRAGRAVGKVAGGHLKRSIFELGGSDPYVVLEDADVAKAASICVASRMINSGQSCIAAKRFIAHEKIAEEFTHLVVEEMRRQRLGNPMDEDCQVGPLARKDLTDALAEQVQKSIAKGARCLVGGNVESRPGYYYQPTVLTDISRASPAYEEELFGPVASIFVAQDEADAIRLANDTRFGLGAAIFSRDIDRAQQLAKESLQAGTVAINDFVRSHPAVPFGGISDSGYGRELSKEGIREFCNAKAVVTG